MKFYYPGDQSFQTELSHPVQCVSGKGLGSVDHAGESLGTVGRFQ